jgi:hypothetical protein
MPANDEEFRLINRNAVKVFDAIAQRACESKISRQELQKAVADYEKRS